MRKTFFLFILLIEFGTAQVTTAIQVFCLIILMFCTFLTLTLADPIDDYSATVINCFDLLV
jgi:hypothetical protein